MAKWILIAVIVLITLYVLFVTGTPVFVFIISTVNPAPKNKSAAIENGKHLLKKTKTVIAVGAHPDDIEWYAGGTLGRLVADHKQVIVVITTDETGLKETRQKEQIRASEIIGYDKVVFLGYPDGSLKDQPREDVVEKLRELYRKYEADTVLAFDPYIQSAIYHHQDHIAAGNAAIEAARAEKIDDVYLFHSGAPDTWIDISETIDLKIEGRDAHDSQTIRLLTPFGMNYLIKEAAYLEGRKADLRYAESFRMLSDD